MSTRSANGADGATRTGWPAKSADPPPGRLERFAAQVAEVKALACELAADRDLPLARWSFPDLAAAASRRGVVDVHHTQVVGHCASTTADSWPIPVEIQSPNRGEAMLGFGQSKA